MCHRVLFVINIGDTREQVSEGTGAGGEPGPDVEHITTMKMRSLVALFVALTCLAACGTRVTGSSANGRRGAAAGAASEEVVPGDQAGAAAGDQGTAAGQGGAAGSGGGAGGGAGAAAASGGRTAGGNAAGTAAKASGAPIVIGAVG